MKENKSSMMQVWVAALFIIILLSTSVCAFAQSNPSEEKALLTILGPQPPQGVCRDSLLFINSSKDGTFAPQAGDNEIIFQTKDNKTVSVKAESVTSDGRLIGVKVPEEAKSGPVTVKKGGVTLADLGICIKSPSGFKWNTGSTPGVVGTIVFGLIIVIAVPLALRKNGWLSQALSESEPLKDKNEMPLFSDKDGKVLNRDPQGNPPAGAFPLYPKSASRLIAFIGLLGIIIWQIVLMIPALSSLACTGTMPDLGSVGKFLVARAGIFTPYIANKITGAIKG